MTRLSAHHGEFSTLAGAPACSTGMAMARDVAALLKLRITFMVVVTAWLGHSLADADPRWPATFAALLGTGLACMGASVLNQVYERDTDALMQRTRLRPLAAGRLPVAPCLFLGLALSIAGVALLASACNALAAALAAFTIGSYVLVYTPLKRVTHTATLVGAVPGALPPVIGYAAAEGRIGPAAVAMFLIMFTWQLPHFLAIAWLHREDYARARLPLLPVIDPSGASTFRQIAVGCLVLLPLGMLPTMWGVSGLLCFYGSLVAGFAFMAFAIALCVGRSTRHARALFLASLVYLPLVLALMAINRIP